MALYADGHAPLPIGGHGTTGAKGPCRGSARGRAPLAARAATHVVAVAFARPTLLHPSTAGGCVASDRACAGGTRLRAVFHSAYSDRGAFAASAPFASCPLGRRRRRDVDRRRSGRELGPVRTAFARERARRRLRGSVFIAGGARARERIAGRVACGAWDVQHGGVLGLGVRAARRIRLGAAGRAHSPAASPQVWLRCSACPGNPTCDCGNARSMRPPRAR